MMPSVLGRFHRSFSVKRIWSGVQRIDIRIWIALFVTLVGLFLWGGRTEFLRMLRSFRTADPWWLSAIILASLAIQLLFAFKFVQLLRIFGHRPRLLPTAEAQLERHAIATVVPVGGAPAALLFLRRLTATGMPESDVLLAFVLFSALGHVSFVIVLLPTIVWLAFAHSASPLIVGAALALTLFALMFIGIVVALLRGANLPVFVGRRLPPRLTRFVADARGHDIRPRTLLRPLASALLVDLSGIAMLDAALRAVGHAPSLGTVAAGYCVGTLFLMLAPVFQGIGLVEVSMVVALERLGIPAGAAATATLLYRTGELWLPLAIGLAAQARREPRLRGAPAHLPAMVTALTGFLSVTSVIAPHVPHRFNRLEDYSLFDPISLSRTLALVSGFVLLLLSYALWRRRWVAWWLALGMLAAIVLAHLNTHHDQSVAVVAAINLALLVAYRKRFRVRSDVPTLRRGVVGFVASLVFALAYGTAGFWFLDRREFGIEFSLAGSLRYSLRLYFSLGSAGLHPRTHYADWFLDSFTVIGVIAVAAAALSLLRPVVWRARTLPQERAEARRLIERFGDSSLDQFKSSSDKHFFFSHRRDAVVAYGLSAATAVVLGDPVAADEEAFRRVLAEFLDFADANAWQVAFHQVPPAHLDAYRDAGLAALKIGEEAVVDVAAFTLSGNAMKSLRAAVNRLTREGYEARFYQPPLSDELLAKLRAVSESWLSLPGRRERGFTLGQWNEEEVRVCPVMTVEHPENGIVAFVNLVRDGVPGEATFDLMRHRADAPSGSMDLLLVRLIQQLQQAGVVRLSLGMAPWSEVGSEPGARLLERGVGALTPRLERFFSVSGLRAYKEKFHPNWEARYLVYGSEAVLPRVALAVVRLTEQGAHLDDDDDSASIPDPRDRHPLPPLAPSAV